MQFAVNDRIVHSTGVGRIDAIESKYIAGSFMLCYRIYLYTKPDVALFIPVLSNTQLRKVASADDVEVFFEKLREPEILPSPKNIHWKRNFKRYSVMARSQSFTERCDAYVYFRHREKISCTEEEFLHKLEDLLVHEIALVTKKLNQVVRQELDAAVLESRQMVGQVQQIKCAA